MLRRGNNFGRSIPILPVRGSMMEKSNLSNLSIGLGLLLWLATAVLCRAQRTDGFEGGDPRWQLVESDCNAQLTEHEISLLMPHGGRTCEQFGVACGTGQLVLMAYPIEPCVVLDEFQPRVWTRCSSGRIQLGVRVNFPQAEHPVTQGRLNVILWGDLYSDTGKWQMLQVRELKRLLQDEVVALRQRFGSDLQLDGAFIDSVVLNVYTGPGRYRVQVDDLDLRGIIPLASIGIPLPANWRERWRWRQATPSAEERFWASANRPPVWLQYQGESLPWVSSLGFSGLLLNQLPSEQQLGRIQDAALGVISPPPAHSLTFNEDISPALRGWLIGAALDGRQTELARAQARLVHQMPQALHRPLVAESLEQFWQFSRIADEVIVPVPSPVSAGTMRDKVTWLTQQLQITKQQGEGWVSLNAGESPATLEQYRAAKAALDPTANFRDNSPADAFTATPLSLDSLPLDSFNANGLAASGRDAPSEYSIANPLGLRHEAVEAVIAGAKGILFRTSKQLSPQSADESANIAAIRWIISDLALWGPWIMAGQASVPPAMNHSDYVVAAWSVAESQLIVAQSATANAQFCVPPTRSEKLEFATQTGSKSLQVLRLTSGVLERVEVQSTPSGLLWSVEKPEPIESFVVTSNPTVLKFLRQKLSATVAQNASDQLEIASYNLVLAAELVDARFSPRDTSADGRAARTAQLEQLKSIQQSLDRGLQELRANRATSATEFAFQASDAIQSILYDAHLVAIANLAAPQSSPFVVSPALLSYHWRLAEACERSQWRELALPGAQLANLSELLDSGWSQQRRLEERVDLRVEIVPAGFERNGGLRLAAYQRTAAAENSPMPGGYEGASLRIRSAAAPVKSGQLVRISATARILKPTTSPDSGLLVYDNQAGPSLGQLIRGAAGERVPVELYRLVVADGEFRLLAECRGECDIILESIVASVIEPATDRRSYPTLPVGSTPPTLIGDVYEQPE
jgi:hypothetical protein